MPTIISMMQINEASQNLMRIRRTNLAPNIWVRLDVNTLIITEGVKQVFSMKNLSVIGDVLFIDYPKNAEGEHGRGWGFLGMLIALHFGLSSGCRYIELGTEIESNSRGFWAKFGILGRHQIPLNSVLDKGISWVRENHTQHNRAYICFTLRDIQVPDNQLPHNQRIQAVLPKRSFEI